MEHLRRYFKTWKEIMFNPLEFFEGLKDEQTYRQSSKFYLITNGILLAIIYLIFLLVSIVILFVAQDKGNDLTAAFNGLGLGIGLLIMLLSFPVMVLYIWGMLFVSAGFLHLFVLLFGGEEGYKETFKAMAYSTAPNLLGFILFVNYLVGPYSAVLLVIGLHKRQQLSIAKSIGVIILPIVIIIALVLMIMLITTI